MDHFECLSLAERRDLDTATAQARQAHLDACEPCQSIVAAWPQAAAVPDLWPGLRDRLLPQLWVPGWLTPAAAGLALALVLSAFWRPERAWLRADQAWAYSDVVAEARP